MLSRRESSKLRGGYIQAFMFAAHIENCPTIRMHPNPAITPSLQGEPNWPDVGESARSLKSMPGLHILVLSLVAWGLTSCSDPKSMKATDWRATLAKPEITQEEFVQAYIDALTEMHPSAEIEAIGPLTLSVDIDGYELPSFLDNAWRDTAEHPKERLERCERHWAGIIEMASSDGHQPIDRSALVPIIKDLLYLEEIEQMGFGDDPIYHEPLVADFIVVYAEDSEHQLAYLTKSKIEGLGMSQEELRAVAIENLDAKIDKLERLGSGPTCMLTAGGTFEASLLLIDGIWEGQAELVEGDLIVAAPSRDMLLFTGSKSAEGIEELKDLVESIHEDGSYLISKTLLVRRDGTWKQFTN